MLRSRRWRAALCAALMAGACARAGPSLRTGASETSDARVQGSFGSGSAARRFTLFRPASARAHARASGGRRLLVVLHGCTQDAGDMARGTRFDAAAAREGWLVLYPEQAASAHPQKCWNWYLPGESRRDSGELALLAHVVDSVRVAEDASPGVMVAGLSAGAAMAANFAVAYPERIAALAMHSGVAALAARDVASALRAMRAGPDSARLGEAVIAAMGSRARAISVIALHGDADAVVSPANLDAVARQWITVNGRVAGRMTPAAVTLPAKGATARRWSNPDGTVRVEAWRLHAVGHAWSGGSATGTYTDSAGPDATAMIVRFLKGDR